MVTKELRQRLMAKAAKIKRYEERIKQEFNGEVSNEKVIPDAEESERLWKEI